MENNDRRDFIKKAGWGAAIMAAITAVPGKLFSSNQSKPATTENAKKVRVSIHPNAVQRNARGKSNE